MVIKLARVPGHDWQRIKKKEFIVELVEIDNE